MNPLKVMIVIVMAIIVVATLWVVPLWLWVISIVIGLVLGLSGPRDGRGRVRSRRYNQRR